MSGGSLNYFYNSLEEHVGDFGDRELDDLLVDLTQLFHDREWFLSGDTSEGHWNEARDSFKAKWFTQDGQKDRVERYLDDIRQEVRMVFGYDQHYCMDCKRFHPSARHPEYGDCENRPHALTHRSDTCRQYEGNE